MHSARLIDDRRGMTLIEILIVVVIMASVLGITVFSVRTLTNAELKATALRFSGTVSYVFGRAAINGMRYQLVIDLDENSYWVECSETEVVLPDELLQASDGDDDERASRYGDGDEEADPFGLNLVQAFDDCSEELIPRRTLPGGIVFDSVMTSHQAEPFDEGQVTIAFFSNGFVEPSIIWMAEEDSESALTLFINPMNARVTIENGHSEIPDDFQEVEEDR